MNFSVVERCGGHEQLISRSVDRTHCSLGTCTEIHCCIEYCCRFAGIRINHCLRALHEVGEQHISELSKALDHYLNCTDLFKRRAVKLATLFVRPRYSLQKWLDVRDACGQITRRNSALRVALHFRKDISAVKDCLKARFDREQCTGICLERSGLIGSHFGQAELVCFSRVLPRTVANGPRACGRYPICQASEAKRFSRVTYPRQDQPAHDRPQKSADNSCHCNVPNLDLSAPAFHVAPMFAVFDVGILA